MTAKQRQKWQRIRAKGYARYILWNILTWGVPMWVAQNYGPRLFDVVIHKQYIPAPPIWSPTMDFIFDLALWVFAFGYVIGDGMWYKNERHYAKHEQAV